LWRFVGVVPSKFFKLVPWVTNLWYLYINILCLLCKYITEGSVHLQHNVMLYISKHLLQKMQGIAAIGVEKCPTIKCDITPNFLLPTNHLSFLHIRYSMVPFCRSPPPPHWRILKKCPEAQQPAITLKGLK
jgi:hypothetical protein